MLVADCCVVSGARCVLWVVCSSVLLTDVCCLSVAVWCMLRVDCCLLCVVCVLLVAV